MNFNKRKITSVLLMLITGLTVYSQVTGEYPPFYGGLGEKGVFQIVNFQGANVILYIQGNQIQEAFAEQEHQMVVDNKFLTFTAARIEDIIPGGRRSRSDLQVLEAFHKWETDYQIEQDPSATILKGVSVKWGQTQCYITEFKYPGTVVNSHVIVSVVANDCVFHMSMPLFKADATPYAALTYDEAVDTIKPFIEKMIIRKDPVPYALLKDLLQSEDKYPEKFR